MCCHLCVIVAAFAFVAIILSILRLLQPLDNKNFVRCKGTTTTALEVTLESLEIVVYLLQTFYIFKYHKVRTADECTRPLL